MEMLIFKMNTRYKSKIDLTVYYKWDIKYAKTYLDKYSIVAKYLHDTIKVVAHGKFWYITHEVIQPVIQACQYIDWFSHIPGRKQEVLEVVDTSRIYRFITFQKVSHLSGLSRIQNVFCQFPQRINLKFKSRG